VQTGSFSKALGGAGGGYVAGSAALIEEIEQRSVAFTATTRIGVHTAVAALASLELIVAQPARLARLHHLAAHLRSCLDAAGIPHSTGASPISIIPVGAESDAQRISARVLEHGFFLPTLVPPVTPPGSARLRLIPSVDHEESDLEEAVEALASAWAAVEPGREPSESWQAAT
jgi:7-keto-8-aminopelargonate synthetase-like enzyme